MVNIKMSINGLLHAAGYEIRRTGWHPVPYANEYDVYYCFRLLFNRDPTDVERERYLGFIRSGIALQDLVTLFMDAPDHLRIRAERLERSSRLELIELPDFKIWISEGDSVIGRIIKAQRSWEPHVETIIRKILRPNMSFVDLGANIGFHTLLAASIVGNEGHVYAFEPNLFNCSLLVRSMNENNFKNVEVFPSAVADSERLMVHTSIGGSNGVISEYTEGSLLAPGQVFTRSVTLDKALDGVDVDLMKLDVEGAENLVLTGARELLARCRPVLISEFSDQLQTVSNVSPLEYATQLVDSGYSLTVLRQDGTFEECGRHPQKTCDALEKTVGQIIDLLATPN
jgi:FkbM family methyltransferase